MSDGHPLELLAAQRELTAPERRALDAHLEGCAECRARQDAYERQDAALRALPALRPARALPERARPAPQGGVLYRLSGAFALAGLAALVWFVILQAQTPGAVAAAPGVTLPATTIRLPSPWLPALPWLSASMLLVGVLLVLSRRSLRAPLAAAIVVSLLLISFVPPLSTVPNPAALYWRLAGGYSYDPRLPFKNNFIIAGQPDRQLEPYLDQLIGATGLAPLDPNQPLADYEILRVGLHPAYNRVALVTTRFIYADGTSRIYPVPLVRPAFDLEGALLGQWRSDGLERLRSVHLDFPGQPFAGPEAPIRLGPARRLDLHPQANRLDEADPTHWLWNSVRLQHLVWAPGGNAFLSAIELDADLRQLWLTPLDGGPPVPIGPAGDIREYGFSPDGATVVYTRLDPDALAANPVAPFAIQAIERGGRAAPRTIATALASGRLPGLSPQGAWFFTQDSQLWIAPLDGGPPASLPSVDAPGQARALPPRPSPDGRGVAYGCGSDLCLHEVASGAVTRVPGLQAGSLEASDLEWAPDGTRLAVVVRDVNNVRPVELHVFDRQGARLFAGEIAPRDVTDPPQWTPDGEAVFVQTYPQDGRRIIAVDLPTARVIDLSQEHWDAYFALAPDGRALLLNNGRGDYWVADVRRAGADG